MWVAFAVAAGFIVYFVQHVTRALAARERELEGARIRTARHEKLASLATLSAGAAHQLATPLSTIAVVARELEHQLVRQKDETETLDDVRLIRDQVQRCRDILIQMAADAGESTGEPIVAVAVDEVLRLALTGLDEATPIALENLAGGRTIVAPVRSVAQALRAVVRNAVDASDRGHPVRLRVTVDSRQWCFEVSDRGAGMAPEVLQRAGEPFFTTKGPDRGMGLGLFLARTVFERLGGDVDLTSRPAFGTTASLHLPLDLTATIRRPPAGRMDAVV
jgi:two-component system sensor histidine kinase RegB